MTKRNLLLCFAIALALSALLFATPDQAVAPVAVEAAARFDVQRAPAPPSGTATTITLDNWVTVEHRNAQGELLGRWRKHNLTPNGGKDFIKAQISGTAVTANCIYIGVDDTAYTPAATDTALPSEVTLNGFARASGTYASTGTGTWTLQKVFTATGAQSNIVAAAVFLDATVGADTMCFGVGSLGPVTLATNDTLTVTWSGTVS